MSVCVCETDGVSVCERYDAGMNVCKNTGFLRAFFNFIFFLRKDKTTNACSVHYFLCHGFCQYDRGVFLQKAKLPPKVKSAAPRASSWAS